MSELLKSMDLGGIVLFAGSIAAVVIGISWRFLVCGSCDSGLTFPPDTYAWSSYQVVVPLCLGFAGLVVFGLYEAFVKCDGA